MRSMTSLRVLIAALLVAAATFVAPAVANADDGGATTYNICQQIPWWPGCPR